MFSICILCIIISNLLRRKVVVETTSLIQKSLNFNNFLFSSEIIPKIINFLNFLIFKIFLHAVNVFSIFDLHVKMIIPVIFIFCTRFISCSSLIYIINFISLLDFRFKRTLILRRRKIEIATVNCLIVIFA